MLPPDFESDPSWFPHALFPATDQLLLVRKSEEDFRSAGFLDDRSVAPQTLRQAVPWSEAEAAPFRRRDAQYIFHIGHVGSTLISRLLGELPEVLALREPVLLRVFSEMARLHGTPESPWPPDWLHPRFDTLAALLSRTFRPEQRAIVKATSFTSEIAPRLVPEGSKALLLFTSPERYVANILGGEASRQELVTLSASRLTRLHKRIGEAPWNLWELAEGEKAGLAYACEMSALAEAADALPGRAMWVDFDAFLAEPEAVLTEIVAFFGHPIEAAEATALCQGPLMRRYSKDLAYEYSPELRRQVLEESRRENAASIQAAIAWIDRAARHPAIAAALDR